MKIIGKHMKQSGLQDIWVEITLLGPGVAESVFEGKDLKKGIRAHKLTLQAFWILLLLPQLFDYLQSENEELYNSIKQVETDEESIQDCIALLMGDQFTAIMNTFISLRSEDDPNFRFWWQYMEMVTILLMFTRAQRDGIWDLHIWAFGQMLPYMMRYVHTNYA